MSEEHKRKISLANKGKKVSKETREKLSKIHKGKIHSEDTKNRIAESHKGKSFSEEAKRKMRESAIEYIKRVAGTICPRIGRHEKEILDELEKQLGRRILRQFECGGYFIDGYIPEINLAIEVDEKYHER